MYFFTNAYDSPSPSSSSTSSTSSTTSTTTASRPSSSSATSVRPIPSPRNTSSSMTPSSSDSLHSISPFSSSVSSTKSKSTCGFPSWPQRSSLHSFQQDESSSYISDEDLFPAEPLSRIDNRQHELSVEEIVAMRLYEEVPAATDVPALVPDGPSKSVTERLLALREASNGSKRPKSSKRRTNERKPRRSSAMAAISEAVE